MSEATEVKEVEGAEAPEKTGGPSIFDDVPIVGEVKTGIDDFISTNLAAPKQQYQPPIEKMPEAKEGEGLFSTHSTEAFGTETPKDTGAGKPPSTGAPEQETPDVKRGRIWRQAVRVVMFIDRVMGSLNGWLNEVDPKTMRADKNDLKLLCDTMYDLMQEKAIEIKEEMSAGLVFATVYLWDTGAGIIHRVGKWWQGRKEPEPEPKPEPTNNERFAPKPKREEPQPFELFRERPKATEPNEPEKTTGKDIRVCKHPECSKALKSRQNHFCGNTHQHQYEAMRKADPDKYPIIHSFTRFRTPEGKFKKVEA